MVLEKTLESPLDCKEIQPVHPKADQSWVFIGRTDAKAETPVFWPPHVKSWLIGKYSDAGRDWEAVGEGDDRGWDGWMISPIRWTWVWVNSGNWWWTGRPAAPAKSLQSCPTLCNPTDGLPPGSPVPGILQARTLEWVAIAFFNIPVQCNQCFQLCLVIYSYWTYVNNYIAME